MISIIIPTYKRLTALQRCVDSVLAQVFDGLEIIIIDDFSEDSTRDYLEKLEAKYSFVKIIHNTENHGVNYSRNRGIELASKKFVLFLDSDDELIPGTLLKIKQTIETFPQTSHFLFIVSDRNEEFKSMVKVEHINYESWLKGKISGDYTHVVLASVMKKYLFFEEFRRFEHLNWVRVKKETSPQLLVPITVAQRERDRPDSLTLSSRLQSLAVIRATFESEKLYYYMYHNDLRKYNPKSLTYQLIYTMLLGGASGDKASSRSLLNYSDKFHIRLLGSMLMMIPSSILQFGIIKYSSFKPR